MTTIDPLISADMLEATRLTREGRLADATALIHRLFHGKRYSGNTSAARVRSAGSGTSPLPSPRLASRVFDVHPTTGAAKTIDGAPAESGTDNQPAPTAISQTPEKLLGFLDQISQRSRMQKLVDLPGRPGGRASVPLPEGARFETRVYADAVGSRAYKLYVPSSLRGGLPVPLVVMLHGCTQSPDDFAAGTRMNTLAEEQNFLVVYPTQPASANAQKCWNWFSPADQERDCGEPALIAGITRQVMRDYAVDPARVYAAGLSAGGAAAAIMGEAYPDLYAAVGVHSGLACGAASDIPSAFAAMRQGGAGTGRKFAGGAMAREARGTVPTIVFHADNDTTVHPRNGEHVLAQAGATAGELRTTVEHGQAPNGGRTFTRTLHANDRGMAVLEQWIVHGGGHAWSGGNSEGSYTDPRGPDASRAMLRFFFDHPHAAPRT
jgi:poly(hydroxyalkanoate) depolymerase family esterase